MGVYVVVHVGARVFVCVCVWTTHLCIPQVIYSPRNAPFNSLLSRLVMILFALAGQVQVARRLTKKNDSAKQAFKFPRAATLDEFDREDGAPSWVPTFHAPTASGGT